MEKTHPINDMMATTIQKVRDLVDANTIVGEPILAGDVTLIPVSKLSFGFGTGGSEYATKNQLPEKENAFGGGGGAGIKITPVAFLVVSGVICQASDHGGSCGQYHRSCGGYGARSSG